MPSYVTISQEKCFEKYRELNLGHHARKKRIKLSRGENMKHIEDILDSFDVKMKPIPSNEHEANLWRNEENRILSSYLRMKEKGFTKKKFFGNFYDSREYSVLTSLQKSDSETNNDPSFQVLGLQKGRIDIS